MCPGLIVAEFLCETEVDDEQLVAAPAVAHDEIVRLDVAVDEVPAVDVLEAAYHLLGEHQRRLHREATRAEVEDVLERRAEQLHDQRVVALRRAKPARARNAGAALREKSTSSLPSEAK